MLKIKVGTYMRSGHDGDNCSHSSGIMSGHVRSQGREDQGMRSFVACMRASHRLYVHRKRHTK